MEIRKPAMIEGAFGQSESAFAADLAWERHYSVSELADKWGLSTRTIIRIFGKEPGVIMWGNSETRFKRGYRTLRIPQSVVERVTSKA